MLLCWSSTFVEPPCGSDSPRFLELRTQSKLSILRLLLPGLLYSTVSNLLDFVALMGGMPDNSIIKECHALCLLALHSADQPILPCPDQLQTFCKECNPLIALHSTYSSLTKFKCRRADKSWLAVCIIGWRIVADVASLKWGQ